MAWALDDALQYAIVPRKLLEDIISERALQIARKQVAKVAHHISLESKGFDEDTTRAQIDEVGAKLTKKSLE